MFAERQLTAVHTRCSTVCLGKMVVRCERHSAVSFGFGRVRYRDRRPFCCCVHRLLERIPENKHAPNTVTTRHFRVWNFSGDFMQGRVVVFANRNCIGENRWSTVAKNTTSRRITGVDAVTYSKRKAINSRNVLCVHGIIVRPSVDEILRFDVITLVSMQSSIGSSRYSTVFSAGAKTASGAVARTSSIPKLNLRLKSVNIRARFYDIPVPELRGCAFLSFYRFLFVTSLIPGAMEEGGAKCPGRGRAHYLDTFVRCFFPNTCRCFTPKR